MVADNQTVEPMFEGVVYREEHVLPDFGMSQRGSVNRAFQQTIRARAAETEAVYLPEILPNVFPKKDGKDESFKSVRLGKDFTEEAEGLDEYFIPLTAELAFGNDGIALLIVQASIGKETGGDVLDVGTSVAGVIAVKSFVKPNQAAFRIMRQATAGFLTSHLLRWVSQVVNEASKLLTLAQSVSMTDGGVGAPKVRLESLGVQFQHTLNHRFQEILSNADPSVKKWSIEALKNLSNDASWDAFIDILEGMSQEQKLKTDGWVINSENATLITLSEQGEGLSLSLCHNDEIREFNKTNDVDKITNWMLNTPCLVSNDLLANLYMSDYKNLLNSIN